MPSKDSPSALPLNDHFSHTRNLDLNKIEGQNGVILGYYGSSSIMENLMCTETTWQQI